MKVCGDPLSSVERDSDGRKDGSPDIPQTRNGGGLTAPAGNFPERRLVTSLYLILALYAVSWAFCSRSLPIYMTIKRSEPSVAPDGSLALGFWPH